MEITISSTDAEVCAKLSGPITEGDGDAVRKGFDELVASPHLKVKLDLALVPIITSTGIGKLILLHKRLKQQGRELVISGIHDNLKTMFAAINLDKMLKITSA